jgi:histidine triad (HIT) family protein
MADCIFCRIIAGELPSQCVYEDESVYAFRDIAPQAPVHILVVPKQHIVSAADITAENSHLAAKCLEVIAKLAKSEGLDSGFRVITSSGQDGGQTVFHLHFHLLGGKPLSANFNISP